MKVKLSVQEQIEHMKSKGIQFNIISEQEAANYLCNNTYYFKLKAYAKNYDKYRTTDRKGQYINLEFAYLKDLAIIDMYLRHFILKASINLEHTLKTQLIRDFNDSPDDGYTLVNKYLTEYPNVKDQINQKRINSYTMDLVNKLEEDGFAIWNIIELLSFKDFLNLYRMFYDEYPSSQTRANVFYPMQGVRKLRNAAAHNNCIINTLRRPYSGKVRYYGTLDRFIKTRIGVDKLSQKNNMANQVIYDFVTLLYLINELTESKGVKKKTFQEVHDLFHNRIKEHADYYKKESSICSTYLFVKKIVDFFYEENI